MANDYYNATASPSTGSSGSSAVMRAEFALIEAGMAKLPALNAANSLPVFVNAGGTALETTSAAVARSRLGISGVENLNNGVTDIGIIVRNGNGTYVTRVLTGTANQITVTNGNGAAGNQTLSLPDPLVVPGNMNATALVTSSALISRGSNQYSNANQAVLDQFSSTASRLISFGPNNTARGAWQVQIRTADGLNVVTAIDVDRVGNVALNNLNVVGIIAGSASMLSPVNNSLAADVALINNSVFFNGPSVAQGTNGTWFAAGTVTVQDQGASAGAAFDVKLWDGTTVISSSRAHTNNVATSASVSLSGYITSPAGNIRMSVKDLTAVTGNIMWNITGTQKDSTITAIRIG